MRQAATGRSAGSSVGEAALMDGCSHFGLFVRIALPMARPGLISVAIFNLLNEGYAGDYSGLFADMTIAMLPVLLTDVVFHRQVLSGLATGLSRS